MQIREPKSTYDITTDTSDSWQRIIETYSRCNLTYPDDKLMAINGLVMDGRDVGKYLYNGSIYVLGLWSNTLHEDLLWIVQPSQKLISVKGRNLPSWTWAAYDGPVTFLKDARSLREPTTMRVAPVQAFERLEICGSPEVTKLPLPYSFSLKVRLECTRVPALELKREESAEARDFWEILRSSPFLHDPGTRNRPILMSSREAYYKMCNQQAGVIGFAVLDTLETPFITDIWCAHTAALHDETYNGPDNLSRVRHAFTEDNVAALSQLGLGEEYQDSPLSHVLAYCLILEPTDIALSEYHRVGIAQVKYEWIRQPSASTITLV